MEGTTQMCSIVVKRSVQTDHKEHQRICTQICFCVLPELGLQAHLFCNGPTPFRSLLTTFLSQNTLLRNISVQPLPKFTSEHESSKGAHDLCVSFSFACGCIMPAQMPRTPTFEQKNLVILPKTHGKTRTNVLFMGDYHVSVLGWGSVCGVCVCMCLCFLHVGVCARVCACMFLRSFLVGASALFGV